jgi:hypothetical protein
MIVKTSFSMDASVIKSLRVAVTGACPKFLGGASLHLRGCLVHPVKGKPDIH